MELTQILQLAEAGDEDARAEIIRAAYADLRQLAGAKMRSERQNHTLSATALVHEVSVKLLNETSLPATGRAQFLAYAAKAMRNLLIDHARTRGRQKRGGDKKKVSFEDALSASQDRNLEFLALNDALDSLAQIDPRKAQVVEMRYFGGLSIQETAEVLCVSVATVKRDWDVAKTWLRRELTSN